MTPPPTYAPRALRHLGHWDIGALRLKVYHIGSGAPDDALVSAARTEAHRMDAAAREEGGAHGAGFVVIHEGEAGTWLLMDWWAHGDILCQRLSLSRGAGFTPQDDRPLTACVWELPVLAHERDAWVRHAMSDAPDIAAYLGDIMRAGQI